MKNLKEEIKELEDWIEKKGGEPKTVKEVTLLSTEVIQKLDRLYKLRSDFYLMKHARIKPE